MYRGFSLLEVLISILLLSILAVKAVPLWKVFNQELILLSEQNRLKLFLRQIQQKSAYSNQIWLIMVNRQLAQQHWCITAQIKHHYLCDCLQPESCPKELLAHFYYPYFPQQSMVISKKYYPQEISRFNGIRDTFSTNCLLLQVGSAQRQLKLFNVGTIRFQSKQNMGACEQQE